MSSLLNPKAHVLVGGLQPTHAIINEFDGLLDNLIITQRSYKEDLLRLLKAEPDQEKHRHSLFIVYLATSMISRVRDLRVQPIVVSDTEFIQFIWETLPYVDVKNYLQGYQSALRKLGKVCTEYVSRVLRLYTPATEEGLLQIKRCYQVIENYYHKVIDGDPSSLTPAHPLLVQLVLAMNHPEAALPIVETPILGMDPHRSGVQLTQYLAYYYYSGVLFASLKKWPQAIAAWESCLAIPKMNVAHPYTIAAASRYILAQLLHTGSFQKTKDPSLSLFHQVLHQEQSLGVYVSLAQAFNQFRLTDFDEIVEKNATALRLSDTLGLVLQVRRALLPAALRRLGDVYCRISVSEALKQLDCEEKELETAVLYLVQHCAFPIHLENNAADLQEGRSLIFGEAAAPSTSTLERALDELVQLDRSLDETHQRILASTENIQLDVRSEPRYRMSGGGGMGGMFGGRGMMGGMDFMTGGMMGGRF